MVTIWSQAYCPNYIMSFDSQTWTLSATSSGWVGVEVRRFFFLFVEALSDYKK